MAAAAAGGLAHAAMDQYLEDVIDVPNIGMRAKLINAGFKSLTALVKKKPSFASEACMTVRKSTTAMPTPRM